MENSIDTNKYSEVLYYKWEKGRFISHNGPKTESCYPVALNPFKILGLTI